ncbi:MAG: DUF742 domain-containing protein [Acidimicrobiales bacterium]
MTDQPRDSRLRVRPYALTGGRVRSSTELALETIVRVTPRGEDDPGTLPSEKRDILRLCADPTSIAEVSAHLHLPLGVARVLVGDLVTEGFLDSHANPASDEEGSRPDLRLLERVLDGLQAL